MFTKRFYFGAIFLCMLCLLALSAAGPAPRTAQAQITIGPASEYNPEINPKDFTIHVDNPYFALPVGRKLVYEAETPDGLVRTEILIPGWTRTVDGVETLVFWDRVFLNDVLVEDTRDYLAQHKETGDVWYFGEHVDHYEDGVVVAHDGAWLAGEDNAKPGIWVLADPQVGDTFRNEFHLGIAEDESEVLSVNENVIVLYGAFTDCIKHLDDSPLIEIEAYTYYCKDIGAPVLAVDLAGAETSVERVVELVDEDPMGALGIALPEAYADEGVVAPNADSQMAAQDEPGDDDDEDGDAGDEPEDGDKNDDGDNSNDDDSGDDNDDGNDNDKGETNDDDDAPPPADTPITAEEAQAIAEQANPGTQAVEVDYESEVGIAHYEVELDNGLEVTVDAATGEITGSEMDD